MKKILVLAFVLLSSVSSVLSGEVEEADKRFWRQKFCIQFEQIPSTQMGLTIKEMEASPYFIDLYFEHSDCQPGAYSEAIKSPMIHYIVDAPMSSPT